MKKTLVKLLVVLIIINISCSVNSQHPEEFNDFYEKFHQDFNFQLERIKFPLPGINSEEMTVLDSVYYWQKENWKFHSKVEIDTTIYHFKTTKSDSVVTEEISSKTSGFVFRRKFELINGKWYLTYLVNFD